MKVTLILGTPNESLKIHHPRTAVQEMKPLDKALYELEGLLIRRYDVYVHIDNQKQTRKLFLDLCVQYGVSLTECLIYEEDNMVDFERPETSEGFTSIVIKRSDACCNSGSYVCR